MDAVEPLKARRIYLLLRERILNGELEAGSRLPGELSIAAEYGISRVTVRRALDTLANDGLIDRRPGSGTFVREGNSVRPIVADLSNVLSHLVEMGRRTGVRLLSFAYVNPPESVAVSLGLAPGERTQRSIRVRLIDGAPFSYLITHVPERIGVTYSETDLASMPLLGLLERSGIVVEEASQSIGATLAGPDVAEALGLEIGSPLLSLTRVVWDPSGQGVEHLHALYRPDRYSFHMDLIRTGAAGARRWNPVVKPSVAGAEIHKRKNKGPESPKQKPRPVRVSNQRRTST
ncbi:GntR family transcriptional regulator [Microvirga rosea]|nr:GntR family transcriptional regulator [Microvirga rosea]MCB8819396.1 GntR family transcriptional regulator [Microvirga rosea]